MSSSRCGARRSVVAAAEWLLAGAVLAGGQAPADDPAGAQSWNAGKGATAYGQQGPMAGAAAAWGESGRSALPGLVLDSGLSRAADACARWLGEHAAAELAPGLVEFSLRWAGCSDPTAVSLMILTSESSPEELWEKIRELRAKAGLRNTHWGFGVAETRRGRFRTAWVALLCERKLELDAVPREVAAGESVRVSGRWLGPSLRSPRLVVQTPGGSVRESSATAQGAAITVTTAPLREAGEHTLEVLADGEYGPEVVALLGVCVGHPPSSTWESREQERMVLVTAEEAERRLLDLANAERGRLGLAPLVPDVVLQSVARAHSTDMVQTGFFGHASPRRGDFDARFRASGWPAMRAAENLSRSESILEAHAGLMASPAHRSNILSPTFTHVGIGVATRLGGLDRTEYIITQVFGLPMPGASLSSRVLPP